MTFLCLACAVTPRLTRGMVDSSCGSVVGQHHADRARVRLRHAGDPAQMTLTLGRLLGEDVAQERARALDLAARTDAETLRGALFRLELGHGLPFVSCDAGWLRAERLTTAAVACLVPRGKRRRYDTTAWCSASRGSSPAAASFPPS